MPSALKIAIALHLIISKTKEKKKKKKKEDIRVTRKVVFKMQTWRMWNGKIFALFKLGGVMVYIG